MSSPSPSSRGSLLAKIGAWMQLAQVVGFAISLASMSRLAVAAGGDVAAQKAPTVQVSPELPESIKQAFSYFHIGIGVAALGLVLVLVSAIGLRYRAAWFFWFLCIYGGAATLSYLFPLGLACVSYALLKRKEFPLDPPPTPGTLV
ncbi:MAG TPA: hypothetical protein VGE29_08490 [Prosthecobacter sp.]